MLLYKAFNFSHAVSTLKCSFRVLTAEFCDWFEETSDRALTNQSKLAAISTN